MPRTKLQSRIEFPTVPEFVRPDLYGVTWGIKELGKVIPKGEKFCREHVLPANRAVLDCKNGGPVLYPTSKTGPYRIKARPMAFWIDQNWEKIITGGW